MSKKLLVKATSGIIGTLLVGNSAIASEKTFTDPITNSDNEKNESIRLASAPKDVRVLLPTDAHARAKFNSLNPKLILPSGIHTLDKNDLLNVGKIVSSLKTRSEREANITLHKDWASVNGKWTPLDGGTVDPISEMLARGRGDGAAKSSDSETSETSESTEGSESSEDSESSESSENNVSTGSSTKFEKMFGEDGVRGPRINPRDLVSRPTIIDLRSNFAK